MVGTFIAYCRATVHSLVHGGAKLHEDLLRTVSFSKSLLRTMIEALCGHLSENPGLYHEDMAIYLREVLDVCVANSTISRALVVKG